MATAEKTLTNSYQLIISGPALVSLEKGSLALLHVAAALPLDTAPAHRLVAGTDRESFTYNGSDNIYARKFDPAGTQVVVISYL
jgi:hypothetical protein